MYLNRYDHKRRIRIQCHDDMASPRKTLVTDIETGQTIDNIQHISIQLDARLLHMAQITYMVYDDQGKAVHDDSKQVTETITLHDFELDVSALEL
jgi:hypothetical protein